MHGASSETFVEMFVFLLFMRWGGIDYYPGEIEIVYKIIFMRYLIEINDE